MRGMLTRRALACLLVVGLAGCGGSEAREAPSQQQGVTEVLQQQMEAEDGASAETAQPGGSQGVATEPVYADAQVDVDLTTMSSDMVYATVNDMMTNPNGYVGKVVRIQGPYYHTFYEQTAADYFYVIVQDATACCSQGIEFVWGDGSHAYPDDYPADGTSATVTGVFEIYQEGDRAYAHLVDADMLVDA